MSGGKFERPRLADLVNHARPEDLELGETLPMIGLLLGQRDINSTARYAHREQPDTDHIRAGRQNDHRTILQARSG